MNAEHNALVKDLIDSAHPHNPHEACEAALEFSIHSAAFFMREADRYQRRCRVLTAVSLALAGVIGWMVTR